MKKEEKKLSKKQLWELLTEQWKKWQSNAHEDDCMSLLDYADEFVGTTFHGVNVVADRHGDIDFIYN